MLLSHKKAFIGGHELSYYVKGFGFCKTMNMKVPYRLGMPK